MPGPDVNLRHLEAIKNRLEAPVQVMALGRAAAVARARPTLFMRDYRHTVGQLPGWQLLRQRVLPSAPGRSDVLRLSQLMLLNDARPACRLKVEVYETPSAAAAQALMIELLTGFEALPDRLPMSHDVGDNGIVMPGDLTRFFTRGNLLVALANAGSELVAVGEAAKALDVFLTAAPIAAAAAHSAHTAGRAATGTGAMQRFLAVEGGLGQNEQGQLVADSGPPSSDVLDEGSGRWVTVVLATSGKAEAGKEDADRADKGGKKNKVGASTDARPERPRRKR